MPPKKKLKFLKEVGDAHILAHIEEDIHAELQQESLKRKQRRQNASAKVKCFVSFIQFLYIFYFHDQQPAYFIMYVDRKYYFYNHLR